VGQTRQPTLGNARWLTFAGALSQNVLAEQKSQGGGTNSGGVQSEEMPTGQL
jgi:hypothetical protein